MADVHANAGAIVVSTLPLELGIDVAALHADVAAPACVSGEHKRNTGLFDRRWNAENVRRKWSEVVKNAMKTEVASEVTGGLEHPAALAARARDPAWQLAPGSQSYIVMGLQVVWIDEHAKLYVTHYIYV